MRDLSIKNKMPTAERVAEDVAYGDAATAIYGRRIYGSSIAPEPTTSEALRERVFEATTGGLGSRVDDVVFDDVGFFAEVGGLEGWRTLLQRLRDESGGVVCE